VEYMDSRTNEPSLPVSQNKYETRYARQNTNGRGLELISIA
jgi:hypothetical protein